MYKNITLKKNEIIKIGDHKYVVYKFTKDTVKLIPLDSALTEVEYSQIIPKIEIKKIFLKQYQKVDNYELLWLLNHKNPLIREVISDFMEKESKRA